MSLTGKQFSLKRKEYGSSLTTYFFFIFAHQTDSGRWTTGTWGESCRVKWRKHPCASHRPTGTNSEAQEDRAIFSFFFMFRMYYWVLVHFCPTCSRVGAFSAGCFTAKHLTMLGLFGVPVCTGRAGASSNSRERKETLSGSTRRFF